jgi:hypothetical protein
VVDLQEATRRDDVYKDLEEIRLKLVDLPVFPSLMWLWAYDVLADVYTNHQAPASEWDEEVIAEGVTLKQIWDKFWIDVDKLGLNMDLGGETIEEVITDWMRDNDFLVVLDNDGWLDDNEDSDDKDN